MQEQMNRGNWIANQKKSDNMHFRLFCFHHAGGNTSIFYNWNKFLSQHIEILPILLPGRGRRIEEPPYTELDTLVQALIGVLLPYLNKPYAFLGYCMGSLIAFELTRGLRKKGKPLPEHLFVSSHSAPQLLMNAEPIRDNQTVTELKAELRRLGGIPEEFFQNDQLLHLLLPMLQADFALSSNYVYHKQAPLDVPITAFYGAQDDRVTYQDTEAWQVQTNKSFTLHIMDGGHFFMKSSYEAVVQVINSKLTLDAECASKSRKIIM